MIFSGEIVHVFFHLLRELLWNRKTNDWYKEGEIIKNHRLAKTLMIIADQGADAFYTGELAADIVADIRDEGLLRHYFEIIIC